MERSEGADEKPDMFWAISSGVILLAMGIGSIFGWYAGKKKKESRPATRKGRQTEEKPAETPAATE